MEQETTKLPCEMCGALILHSTARKNGGVCMKCLPRFRAKRLTLSPDAQQEFAKFWSALEKCGWLAELPSDAAENLRLDLIGCFDAAEEDPLAILATGYIVAESIESEGDYVALLRELQRASGGVFAPDNAEDSFDEEGGEATLSFEWRGNSYGITVPFENDDYHPDVIFYVNDVLAENGIGKRLLPLFFDDDPGVSVVFISEETYDRAVRIGLIPDLSAA